MTRSAALAFAAIAFLAAGCLPFAGAPGGRAEAPPRQQPYLQGEVLGVEPILPRTENCAPPEDADTNDDGWADSNDLPPCNPEPDAVGIIHMRGFRKEQGGVTELEATVLKETPVARKVGRLFARVPFSDVERGQVVSVWIDGEVNESFPAQANGTYVLVEPP